MRPNYVTNRLHHEIMVLIARLTINSIEVLAIASCNILLHPVPVKK